MTQCKKNMLRHATEMTDHAFMVTTDGGLNEQRGRKIVAAEIMDSPNMFFFQQDCLEHSPHLVVVSSLLLVDDLLAGTVDWKYWSSLAMFAHTCRDQARSLYDTYSARFGALNAKRTVKSLFPRPVSQRWGRIHELEERIMAAGFSELAISISEILLRKWIDPSELSSSLNTSGWKAGDSVAEAIKKAAKQSKTAKDVDHDDGDKDKKTEKKQKKRENPHEKSERTPNELSVEQTKEYTIKMGRWRARTLQTVGDQLWGMVVTIMHCTRDPLIHITNSLKQKIAQHDMVETGRPLTRLVFGKAAEIFEDFNRILGSVRTTVAMFGTVSFRLNILFGPYNLYFICFYFLVFLFIYVCYYVLDS